MPTSSRRDTGGAVVAALLVVAGCFVVSDTLGYVDPDSAVFPRTFAGVMIAASLGYLFMWLSGRGEELAEPEGGSMLRRVLLVAVMVLGAMAMPWTGFIPAALVIFAALTLVAMYDPWTPYRMAVYPLVGLAIVFGFYYIFQELLQVPLPTARLF
ncbi:MAG: tripartite tricarboxylate transporter TctB family protein [Hyphomicrobiales bacterium]